MTTGIVLGGGIQLDGKLTTLSKQRLDAACVLFDAQAINKIIVLGGLKSTYFSNAIEFEHTGASKRAKYLRQNRVPADLIHEIHDGKDTIGEAIAFKNSPFLAGNDSFILITSDIHMPRALWIFQKILGSQIKLAPHEVDCEGILDANEEAEYFEATKNWFERKSDADFVTNTWHRDNPELYQQFKMIHDRFHPPGRESQAYFAVTSTKI